MNSVIETLSEEEKARLRKEFQLPQPTGWVLKLAHDKDWRAANEAFLQKEREWGRREMEHLMEASGAKKPVSPTEAANLVAAALTLYVSPDQSEDAVRLIGDTTVALRVCDCPSFRRMEAAHWRGVTACSSWHRRRGWYDALGVNPRDSVIAESKWGDQACEAVIEFAD